MMHYTPKPSDCARAFGHLNTILLITCNVEFIAHTLIYNSNLYLCQRKKMVNYICGYPLPILAAWGLHKPPVPWHTCSSTLQDTLVFGDYGPCPCDPKTFSGAILSVNGEGTPVEPYTKNTINVGVGGYDLPYGAIEWINRRYEQSKNSDRLRAVAYVQSNCVKHREDMAVALSKTIQVHALGRCNANGRIKRLSSPFHHWHDNTRIFTRYDFALTSENQYYNTKGYVSEKAFVASAAGAIPIYYGDRHSAFKYLNPERVLFWNESVPDIVGAMNTEQIRNLQNLPAVNMLAITNSARAVFKMLNATSLVMQIDK